MNKKQRMVIGIALILMGIVTFLFNTMVVEMWHYASGRLGYKVDFLPNSRAWLECLLAIVFTGGGIFILISKEGDLKKEIKK